MNVDIQCVNHLTDNDYVYAMKAKRKKIAIIGVRAMNRDTSPMRLLLGSSKLIADGRSYDAEDPAAIRRKLGEFTWDFLLYSLIDFHPISAIVDMSMMLTGPIYNRRLKRQLALLSNTELSLSTGESKSALLAFRGPSKHLDSLRLRGVDADGGESMLEFKIGTA